MKRRRAMGEIRFNNQKDIVITTIMDRLEFFEKQSIYMENELKISARKSDDVKLLM